MLPFIRNQDGNITVLIDCQPFTFSKGHPNYTQLMDSISDGSSDKFNRLFDIQKSLNDALRVTNSVKNGKFEIDNGRVLFNGEEQKTLVADMIIEAWRNNKPYTNLANFLIKISENPSRNSVEQLYNFLQAKGLPITEDGDFIAWKSVRNDYLDKYSGTISNKVGAIVEVTRNKVDDDIANECSHGLHVGALSYSGPNGWYHSDGDIVLAVKVNPRDAVAVPKDHNFTKLRVCRYEVIGEYKNETTARVVKDKDVDTFVKNISPTASLKLHVEDFLGAKVGDVVEFVYVKPDGITDRKVSIESFGYDDDNHINKIFGVDMNDGKQKSFKVDRIDLESFEVA